MITLPKTLAISIKGKSNVSATLQLPSSVINGVHNFYIARFCHDRLFLYLH